MFQCTTVHAMTVQAGLDRVHKAGHVCKHGRQQYWKHVECRFAALLLHYRYAAFACCFQGLSKSLPVTGSTVSCTDAASNVYASWAHTVLVISIVLLVSILAVSQQCPNCGKSAARQD